VSSRVACQSTSRSIYIKRQTLLLVIEEMVVHWYWITDILEMAASLLAKKKRDDPWQCHGWCDGRRVSSIQGGLYMQYGYAEFSDHCGLFCGVLCLIPCLVDLLWGVGRCGHNEEHGLWCVPVFDLLV
jgi:hypothetical protein